jgi:hypothetical protein
MNNLVTATNTWEITPKAKLTEKVFTRGQTVKLTTESGPLGLNTVMVFGKDIMVILILGNGIKTKLMATVSMSGLMETNMKVNGSFV